MYEKLSITKCDFCGKGMPGGRSTEKKLNGRRMVFCEKSCYELYLEYDEIRRNNEERGGIRKG